jgi:hypothetical protein
MIAKYLRITFVSPDPEKSAEIRRRIWHRKSYTEIDPILIDPDQKTMTLDQPELTYCLIPEIWGRTTANLEFVGSLRLSENRAVSS